MEYFTVEQTKTQYRVDINRAVSQRHTQGDEYNERRKWLSDFKVDVKTRCRQVDEQSAVRLLKYLILSVRRDAKRGLYEYKLFQRFNFNFERNICNLFRALSIIHRHYSVCAFRIFTLRVRFADPMKSDKYLWGNVWVGRTKLHVLHVYVRNL